MTVSIKLTVNDNNCSCPFINSVTFSCGSACSYSVIVLTSATTVNLSSSGVRAYVNSALTRHLGVFKHARDTSQHKATVENTLLRDLRADGIIGRQKGKEEDKLEEVKKKKSKAAAAKRGYEDGRNTQRGATSSRVLYVKQWPSHSQCSTVEKASCWKSRQPFRPSDVRVFFLPSQSLSLSTLDSLFIAMAIMLVSHLHISLLLNTFEKEYGTEIERE